MTLESMLNGYFSAVVLAHKTSDDGPLMFSKGVACDVVGNAQKDEGVEDSLEP